jgi:hypothetical protein
MEQSRSRWTQKDLEQTCDANETWTNEQQMTIDGIYKYVVNYINK